MALSPLAVQELAEGVLGCICEALDDTAAKVDGQPGCPCRSCVVPGQPAWDTCDDPCGEAATTGGQLTVNVARMYASSLDTFPSTEARDQAVRGKRGCKLPGLTAVELVITVLRCVPTPNDQGCPPSCEDLAAAARVINFDAVSVLNALDCCLPALGVRRQGLLYVIGAQRQVGPEGGCAGTEQRVTVGLVNCKCPDDETP
ncbi:MULTISPECIES: hypothetical protein [unclassified Streptomyces]|uniref:hypothetical protein n=1 Tax=unclassified Streptomyces TaxID=2593676 RepID=UPI0033A162E8